MRHSLKIRGKIAALQMYRLGILVAIVLLVRNHHVDLRVNGQRPVKVDEVRRFYPNAKKLRCEPSDRAELDVLDENGDRVGAVVHTSPICDSLIGYCGPTDTLIAFDGNWKVLGIQIRRSWDTTSHAEIVASDGYFMGTWNGLTWDHVAGLDIEEAGIEGVSGATMTSVNMAESIIARCRHANRQAAARPQFRINANDAGLGLVVVGALLLAFSKARRHRWLRRSFQLAVVIYIGLVSSHMVAQSVLAGWSQFEVPWRAAPGFVLLVVAALIVPWATRRPVYCQHICPHGAVQEWLGRLAPRMTRIRLPAAVSQGLRWLPPLSLVVVLLATMLPLPMDLANIEPFDAYTLRSITRASVVIALAGFVASLFVPLAYCKYGCPTGTLLQFVRSHGRADRFSRRDVVAAILLAMVAAIDWQYATITIWLLR